MAENLSIYTKEQQHSKKQGTNLSAAIIVSTLFTLSANVSSGVDGRLRTSATLVSAVQLASPDTSKITAHHMPPSATPQGRQQKVNLEISTSSLYLGRVPIAAGAFVLQRDEVGRMDGNTAADKSVQAELINIGPSLYQVIWRTELSYPDNEGNRSQNIDLMLGIDL